MDVGAGMTWHESRANKSGILFDPSGVRAVMALH
jgi:hypothetical protein